MVIHKSPQFTLYIGDAEDEMYPSDYLNWRPEGLILKHPLRKVREQLRAQEVLFLHQKHSINGHIVDKAFIEKEAAFTRKGDYLITQLPKIAIGVLSADCLPVIAYDRRFNVVGIAHAGWRGAIAGTIPGMIAQMQEAFRCDPSDLLLLYGPSAKRCCYEVSEDFLEQLDAYPFVDQVIRRLGNMLFFDLPHFIELQLVHRGIVPREIINQYNNCTICDYRFHSHRRGSCGRQMTVVALN